MRPTKPPIIIRLRTAAALSASMPASDAFETAWIKGIAMQTQQKTMATLSTVVSLAGDMAPPSARVQSRRAVALPPEFSWPGGRRMRMVIGINSNQIATPMMT